MNRSATAVPARLAYRAARRGALIWGVVFGLFVVGSAQGFVAAYPTAADRARFAASFGTNPGLRALVGVPRRIDTVAGFTAWRSVGVLSLVGAVWGILVATRSLRGEEDTGRWGLVLAGPVTRRGATTAALAGLGAALAGLWAVTAAISPAGAGGISPGSYLVLALALVASPAMAVALGALASQLAGSRRQAAGLAGGVLGAWFLLRLIADSGSSTGWLRWATPMGWVEELRPLTGVRPTAFVLVLALTALLVVTCVAVAARRDEAAGILPAQDTAPARTGLLSGPLGLAARLARPATLAWSLGLASAAFVFGLVAKAAAEATASSSAQEFLARLGIRQAGEEAYLGVTFLTLGTVVALVAAGHAAAARDEEASGRLEHLLVRPVARTRWLGGRTAVALAELLAIGVLVGSAAWLGTALEGSPVSLGRALTAGLNLLPAAILVLGVGVLLFGVAPRAAAAGAYGIVAWSFVLEFVASLVKAPSWLLDLSVLHHVALAPAVDPDWLGGAVLVVLGALAVVVGAAAFGRRDIAGA